MNGLPRVLITTIFTLLALVSTPADEELGRFSANPFNPDSTGNPLGAGSVHRRHGVNNPASPYGSITSDRSANDPTATDAPKLYDDAGNYRGRLSSNPQDPDSIANPHGRFGSRHSPDSVNNPHGLGNPLHPDSPANPYGRGLRIVGSSAADDSRERSAGDQGADSAARAGKAETASQGNASTDEQP